MSKRMNSKVVETENTVQKEQIVQWLAEESETRRNGVVDRIRELTNQILEIEPEISLGKLTKVASKMENREVEYSVVRYAVLKMEGVEVVKKGKINWVRRK